jgi:hypothetical protein
VDGAKLTGGQLGRGVAEGSRHQWLPTVKKRVASSGPGSSEQGSAWLMVGAPVDGSSGHTTWLPIGDGLPAHSGGRAVDVV